MNRKTRKNLGLRIRQHVLLRYDERGDDVGPKTGSATEEENDPQQTDDCGVKLEIFTDASANAAEFFVRHRTIKSLVHFDKVLLRFTRNGFTGAKLH